jgi:hypothetical protein
MRNPIQPSLQRPVPLPDCILMDAWWADLADENRRRPAPPLHAVPDAGPVSADALRLRARERRD